MVRMLARLAAAALLVTAAPALAWWDYGHRTVATLAWAYMTPQAKLAARRLIAGARALETPTCPIRSLEDAAAWPDCAKDLGDRFSYATPWHYQNNDVCKPFDPKANCPSGNCVTAQIDRQARLLGDPKVPARERLMALAFLVHFVGDLHQPLHAGDRGDLGGNRIKARYGAIEYDRLNLHSVWDGLIAERAISEPPPLRATITPALKAQWEQGATADWARESWERARDITYGDLPAPAAACPAGKLDQRLTIGPDYVARAIAPIRTGVAQAGVRAALLINRALDPKATKAVPAG